jgi:CrcB protein
MVRFMISGIVARAGNMQLPVATFGINIAGSFLIGLLFGLSIRENSALSQPMMLLLATGFCGGFTTFSAFALENINLLQKGAPLTAMGYSIASVVCGLLFCRLGLWLAA